MLMRAQDERDASLEEASRAACAYFGAHSSPRSFTLFIREGSRATALAL